MVTQASVEWTFADVLPLAAAMSCPSAHPLETLGIKIPTLNFPLPPSLESDACDLLLHLLPVPKSGCSCIAKIQRSWQSVSCCI